MDILLRLIADWLVVAIIVFAAISYISKVKTDRYQRYGRSFMAGLSAYTVGKLFSMAANQTERPFEALGVAPGASYLDNPGFPSDHVLFTVTLALIVGAETNNMKFFWILIGLSLIVGIGRVLTLVHSPWDVLGGAIAATLGVGIWYAPRLLKNYF